jgi:hypothetical protein
MNSNDLGQANAFPIWRILRPSNRPLSITGFERVRLIHGIAISNQTKIVVGRSFSFPSSEDKGEIELVAIYPSELGYELALRNAEPSEESVSQYGHQFTLREFFSLAEKNGLSLCAGDICPQISLLCASLSKLEIFAIAMNPILNLQGDPCLLCIEHNEHGRVLRTYIGQLDKIKHDTTRFIFVRRK